MLSEELERKGKEKTLFSVFKRKRVKELQPSFVKYTIQDRIPFFSVIFSVVIH